ncbi:MAG: 4Fe-4S binding protein [Clostridia bacterium]|nr:4Fe-4S binding protein [Clostridia bacterium]
MGSVNWSTFGIVTLIVAVIAIIFAVLIVIVYKLCHVEEDKTVEVISEKLAGANCGGCGFTGCNAFAKALAEGKANLSMCGPTANENKAEIAKLLNLPFTAEEQAYAVVKCAGGLNSKNKFEYVGNEGCIAQIAFMGGKKVCPNGCLCGGTCASLCPYHAITPSKDGVMVVNKALCEACGVCAKKCPKHIIELIPKSSKVYVACSTTCKGKEVVNTCKVGCISCGLCEKACKYGAIKLENNVPVIDYKKCVGCKACVSACRRKVIKEI